MNAQIFKTPTGEEMVVLSRAEYDALIARLEELEEDAADAEAARVAKAADGGDRRVVTGDQTRGHYLRFLRKAVGMTQVELASGTGLTQGYVSDLESGRRRPSIEAYESIVRVLGVSDDEHLMALRDGWGLSPGA